MLLWYKITRVVVKKAFSRSGCVKKEKMNTATSMSTKILVMKLGVIMQLNLIDYQELTQTAWGRSQHNNRLNKCVLFLHKELNAENIVVECDIASLNYTLFVQSNRLTIREDNLYLHATYHTPSIVFPGVDWIKFIWKLIWERGKRRSKFSLNGHGTEM